MPYLRRQARIPFNGRVTARLTLEQRNLLLGTVTVPQSLGHALARAAVRNGKLGLEVKREDLERLIMTAASTQAPGRAADRDLVRLLDYLESLLDRFEEPEESGA